MSVELSARPRRSTVRYCLAEARPVVQVIFVLRFVAGASLAGPALTAGTAARLLYGAVAWWCAVVFVYLYNGVADAVEDQASAKDRPLARGDLSRRTAIRWCGYFAGAGLVCGFNLSPLFGALVAAFVLLGYLYSAPPVALKRHCAGAAVVAALGGMLTVVAGYVLIGAPLGRPQLALYALAMAAWMGCVGSVAKDFSDVRGDRLAGRRTVILLFGPAAARIVVALCAVAVATAFLACAWAWAPTLLPSAVIMLLGSAVVAGRALAGAAGDQRRARAPYRAFMVTQYLATLSVMAG